MSTVFQNETNTDVLIVHAASVTNRGYSHANCERPAARAVHPTKKGKYSSRKKN